VPRIPIVGRLFLREYSVLFISFVLIVFEALIRYSTILLPQSVVDWFYGHSKTVFHIFVRSPRPKTPESKWADQIRTSSSFEDLCNLYGYTVESHIVQTKDGYLLGLHRLPARRYQKKTRPGTTTRKKVVYLHHGLLMNSEVWVCITDFERILPFALVEQGYDVWFGNNRGNKYSKKAIHCTPNQTRFWNYSLDELCMHDIPDSIEYVLNVTGEKSLSYIGFSQGTAQAFAALSIHPQLNQKVNLMIALAPAVSPPGLFQPIVDGLMKASPTLVFLFFGRKAILSSAVMWQSILYNPIWNWTIDAGLRFLFNWHGLNMSTSQKVAAYSHLYSFTSVKAVVHWFQIMRTAAFQMYDDDVQSGLYSKSFYHPAPFPTRNITSPIMLLYGTHDSLVDIDVMLSQLPDHTVAKPIRDYEHVDILWGRDVDTLVIPEVLKGLKQLDEPGAQDDNRSASEEVDSDRLCEGEE